MCDVLVSVGQGHRRGRGTIWTGRRSTWPAETVSQQSSQPMPPEDDQGLMEWWWCRSHVGGACAAGADAAPRDQRTRRQIQGEADRGGEHDQPLKTVVHSACVLW
jgi:hypothetical protein